MNQKSLSTITVECFGCHKIVTHPYTDFEFRIEQFISKEGWVRRDFGPNARIWFCSSKCAYHSYSALQCEEWWRIHQEKTISTVKTVINTTLTIAITLIISFVLQYLIER